MPYYRFVTEEELDRIRQHGLLMPQGHYPPYRPNEIICFFESRDLTALFHRYGRTLAEQRDLAPGMKLIVIELVGFAGRIELDKSQGGWPESRSIFDQIPMERLKIVAQAIVQDVRGGQATLSPLQVEPENLPHL